MLYKTWRKTMNREAVINSPVIPLKHSSRYWMPMYPLKLIDQTLKLLCEEGRAVCEHDGSLPYIPFSGSSGKIQSKKFTKTYTIFDKNKAKGSEKAFVSYVLIKNVRMTLYVDTVMGKGFIQIKEEDLKTLNSWGININPKDKQDGNM